MDTVVAKTKTFHVFIFPDDEGEAAGLLSIRRYERTQVKINAKKQGKKNLNKLKLCI